MVVKVAKGLSIKDIHSEGGRWFVQYGHFADKEGFLQLRTSALFGAKKFGIF